MFKAIIAFCLTTCFSLHSLTYEPKVLINKIEKADIDGFIEFFNEIKDLEANTSQAFVSEIYEHYTCIYGTAIFEQEEYKN